MSKPLKVIMLLLVAHMAIAQPSLIEAEKNYKLSFANRLPFWETVNLAHKALSLSTELKNDRLICLSHTQLGILYWNDGQFSNALLHLDKGKNLAMQLNDSITVAKCFHYKGLVYYYQCAFDTALAFYDQAERVYGQLKKDSAIAKVKNHKGLIYDVLGDYNAVLENMMESFRLQEKMPGNRDLSVQLQFPSKAAEDLYYRSKLEKDLESLKFLESGKEDTDRLAFAVQNVGLDFYYLNRHEEALSYFRRATALYKKIGKPPFMDMQAISFSALGQYDSAHFYFDLRLPEVKRNGTQIHLAALYANIGALYRKEEKWKDALIYYDLSQELDREMNLRRAAASVGKIKSELLAKMGFIDLALQQIDYSLSIANSIRSIKDKEAFLKVKGDLLMKANRYREAAEVLKQSRALYDSITEGESQLQIARLQIEYESDKKNRDLLNLQAQNQVKEAEIKNKNLLITLALVIVFFGIGLVLFIYQRYRQKLRNERLLEERNNLIVRQNEMLLVQDKQKEVLLHEIHHRVKNNLQIMASLISLKARQSSLETAEALQQLHARIFSMGLLHEKLYRNEDIRTIRLDEYLVELTRYMVDSLGNPQSPLHIKHNCESLEVDFESVLTYGLICNELLTNTMKHAFADDQTYREVQLNLKRTGNVIELSFADNGRRSKHLPEDMKKSFGMRFIEQLISSRLQGDWNTSFENGFHVNITAPMRGNTLYTMETEGLGKAGITAVNLLHH